MQPSTVFLRFWTPIACACLGLGPVAVAQVHFSHDAGTTGLPPGAVNAAPDTQDVFFSDVTVGDTVSLHSNVLKVDDPLALGLMLGDNIDAMADDGSRPAAQHTITFFQPQFVFSVRPGAIGEMGTPIDLAQPFNAADIYSIEGPHNGGHELQLNEFQMDLDPALPSESIDALSTQLEPFFDPGDRIYFSLTPGSPTLAANGWSAADILTVVIGSPATLQRAAAAVDLGLLDTDDLDALTLFGAIDGDGDGQLSGVLDLALAYFSVADGSQGVAGSDVRAEALGNGAEGDVFVSAIAEGHTLMFDNVVWTLLESPDDIDALDVLGDLSGPPPPPSIRGDPGGGGYCGIWMGLCEGAIPTRKVPVNVMVDLVDANGQVVASINQSAVDSGAGAVRGQQAADTKAKLIESILSGITYNKNGTDVPVFTGFTYDKNHPHFMHSQILGELCFAINPVLTACGLSLQNFQLGYEKWTGSMVPQPYPDNTTKKRKYEVIVGDAFSDGIFRATFGDTLGLATTFAVGFSIGETGLTIMQRFADAVNAGGGTAVISNGSVVISEVPVEPPGTDGFFGPYAYEIGANGSDVMIHMTLITEECDTEASVISFNGSGMNPNTLTGTTLPVLGEDFSVALDCTAHAMGFGLVFIRSGVVLVPTILGELLVIGTPILDLFAPHSQSVVDLTAQIPNDIALCGRVGYMQGACTGSPGIQLSNGLEIRLGGPPDPVPTTNDECSGAIEIICNSTAIADNTAATTSASDPGYSCHFSGPGTQGLGTLWYSFVALATTATIDTEGSVAPASDSMLAVYSGSCGALTEIGCDDEGGSGSLSSLTLGGLTPGNTYYIQLASFSASSLGAYDLTVTCP